jgi:hypothetical protein
VSVSCPQAVGEVGNSSNLTSPMRILTVGGRLVTVAEFGQLLKGRTTGALRERRPRALVRRAVHPGQRAIGSAAPHGRAAAGVPRSRNGGQGLASVSSQGRGGCPIGWFRGGLRR